MESAGPITTHAKTWNDRSRKPYLRAWVQRRSAPLQQVSPAIMNASAAEAEAMKKSQERVVKENHRKAGRGSIRASLCVGKPTRAMHSGRTDAAPAESNPAESRTEQEKAAKGATYGRLVRRKANESYAQWPYRCNA